MLVVLVGVTTVVVVVLGVLLLVRLAKTQDDAPPPSRGGDFLAPVSSGHYRFRAPDESPEQFKARVEAENEEIASSRK